MKASVAMLLVLLFVGMTVAQAHPGPKDDSGCHLDDNGVRHCH